MRIGHSLSSQIGDGWNVHLRQRRDREYKHRRTEERATSEFAKKLDIVIREAKRRGPIQEFDVCVGRWTRQLPWYLRHRFFFEQQLQDEPQIRPTRYEEFVTQPQRGVAAMMEFCGYDSSIPERRIQQLRDSAKPYLIAPFTEGHQQPWYGWRPMTWDSLPIIGPVPRLANAYLATGHNMLGHSLATATGKLIAEIISQRPTHIDPSAYSPQRF